MWTIVVTKHLHLQLQPSASLQAAALLLSSRRASYLQSLRRRLPHIRKVLVFVAARFLRPSFSSHLFALPGSPLTPLGRLGCGGAVNAASLRLVAVTITDHKGALLADWLWIVFICCVGKCLTEEWRQDKIPSHWDEEFLSTLSIFMLLFGSLYRCVSCGGLYKKKNSMHIVFYCLCSKYTSWLPTSPHQSLMWLCQLKEESIVFSSVLPEISISMCLTAVRFQWFLYSNTSTPH